MCWRVGVLAGGEANPNPHQTRDALVFFGRITALAVRGKANRCCLGEQAGGGKRYRGCVSLSPLVFIRVRGDAVVWTKKMMYPMMLPAFEALFKCGLG